MPANCGSGQSLFAFGTDIIGNLGLGQLVEVQPVKMGHQVSNVDPIAISRSWLEKGKVVLAEPVGHFHEGVATNAGSGEALHFFLMVHQDLHGFCLDGGS